MSNAWYHYVVPLAISSVFVIVGVVSFCALWWGPREADGRRKHGIAAVIGGVFGLTVGGCVGTSILKSPTPWEREQIFDHVFRTAPERIERFIIMAGNPEHYRPLTLSEVVIDDPVRIRQIAKILRSAPEVSPNHPRTRWHANIKMVTHDGIYYFGVNATESDDPNGTLLSPWANERGSWNLGNVRADGLEEILEDAVKKARKP